MGKNSSRKLIEKIVNPKIGEEFKYRKLSPMFAFENWEIYALPVVNGIVYAIIGLHDGKRVFYAEDSKVNLCIKNFRFVF